MVWVFVPDGECCQTRWKLRVWAKRSASKQEHKASVHVWWHADWQQGHLHLNAHWLAPCESGGTLCGL